MRRILFTILCLAGLLFPTMSRADYSYTGAMKSHNDTLQFTFTVVGESTLVTFFTEVWKEYNLDLMLTVWDDDGNLECLFNDYNADTLYLSGGVIYSIGLYDVFGSYLFPDGTYTAILTHGENWNNSDYLLDGFEFDAETPQPLEEWDDSITNFVSFHINGASSVTGPKETVVPEPCTLAVIGLGLVGWTFTRKYTRKKTVR